MNAKTYKLPTGEFAADWSTDDAAYQVTTLAHRTVLLGVKVANGEWRVITVVNPDRFGEFKTFKAWQQWVTKFIEPGEDD